MTESRAPIHTAHLEITVTEGAPPMGAYLACPSAPGPHPALLILQEIFGVNAHIRDIAERFAREGYVTLAPALFHRIPGAGSGYEGSYDDVPASMAVAMKLDPAGVSADLGAAHRYLANHQAVRATHIGALGFCMGGRLAFLANAVLPLAAAVSYYGNVPAEMLGLAAKQSGPVLFYWAGKDSYISTEQHRAVAEAMRAGQKPCVDVEFSGVDHGFYCDARSSYDRAAATQSHALTTAFLRTFMS